MNPFDSMKLSMRKLDDVFAKGCSTLFDFKDIDVKLFSEKLKRPITDAYEDDNEKEEEYKLRKK